MVTAFRLTNQPIIHQGLCPSLGDNINGPSLVVRPDWAPGEGRYILYFSHHKGQHIRLAVADQLTGPWQVYRPGVLHLRETPLAQYRPDLPQPAWAEEAGTDGLYPHLASPDVWIDEKTRCFRMIYHGLADHGEQVSYEACSPDGYAWTTEGPEIAETYLRRFTYDGVVYALARLGQLMRRDTDGWQIGPKLLPGTVRHVALITRGSRLCVLYSEIGDAPERIMHRQIEMTGDWRTWTPGPETELLRPEHKWEGAELPPTASIAGATEFTHQLRDPDLLQIDDDVILIYAGGGESALGVARVVFDQVSESANSRDRVER